MRYLLPRYVFRHGATRLLAACIAALAASLQAGAVLASDETAPREGKAAQADDPHYRRVLKAYRGDVTPEEIDALGEADPTPSLFAGPGTSPGHLLARLFASMPDSAHAELRRGGYLKWRAASLPALQGRWLKDALAKLEKAARETYPLQGKGASLTGFVRVEVEGVDGPVYSWWISSSAARRPVWVTLVRGRGAAGPAFAAAHERVLALLQDKPDTPPVPEREWAVVKEARPAGEKAVPLIDEKYYRSVVKAYRGDLGKEAVQALTDGDPLLRRRLLTSDEGDRALNQFFGGLAERDHRALVTTGRLLWRADQLSREQRRILESVVRGLNTQGSQEPLSLESFSGTLIGITLVQVPGEEMPVVSWWIRALAALNPSWVSLTNGRALANPAYYKAHLQQLPGR
jgi:hypothetical protein